jgi:hypothetical protein
MDAAHLVVARIPQAPYRIFWIIEHEGRADGLNRGRRDHEYKRDDWVLYCCSAN